MVQGGRSEFVLARRYVSENAHGIITHIFLARLFCLPFAILGAVVCWRWATEMYGRASGFISLLLWCFCPYILGHAPSIMNDAPASSLGVAAGYTFWRWLKRPGLLRSALAGISLGAALLCKFTIVIFVPLFIFIYILHNSRNNNNVKSKNLQFLIVLLLSWYTLNSFYLFEGTFKRFRHIKFHTRILSGHVSLHDIPPGGSNFLENRWLGYFPILLPTEYVQGFDTQLLDFERGLMSYLCGEWSGTGWWYYYAVALLAKLPIGTLLVVALALLASVTRSGASSDFLDESMLILPIVSIFLLVSSQWRVSVHSRYILPMLPFLFVWAGKVWRSNKRAWWFVKPVSVFALVWSITSSLAIFPHSLSYFNEGVGGPVNGPLVLLDSNIDWGQDLLFLKRWLDKNPDVRLDGLAYYGMIDPSCVGIPKTPMPNPGIDAEVAQDSPIAMTHGPKPGVYALSVNYIFSYSQEYSYFRKFRPTFTAGYSIYIYKLSKEDIKSSYE
jgi:hypothetical protein